MKKIMLIALSLLLCAATLASCSSDKYAPADYQTKVAVGGEIEGKYMASGDYSVSSTEQVVLQGFGKFITYYPDAIKTSADKLPVIVLCNGTGAPMSKYPAVAKHLASWGFIVIGTEEEYDWNGFAAEMCIRYLELLEKSETVGSDDDKKENIFFGKIDLENVGIVGHSQGGVGVINAITAQPHSSVFKAAVSLSPTNKALAKDLLWDYDATLIDIPFMLISGAGGGDDWVVTGEGLREIYDDVRSDKIMLRRNDTPHGEVLYSANGYVTAFFMWQLRGDEYAARAFSGDAPEMFENPLYTDQRTDISEN